MVPEAGYWLLPDELNDKEEEGSVGVFSCPKGACLQGGVCSAGRGGLLCSQCLAGAGLSQRLPCLLPKLAAQVLFHAHPDARHRVRSDLARRSCFCVCGRLCFGRCAAPLVRLCLQLSVLLLPCAPAPTHRLQLALDDCCLTALG